VRAVLVFLASCALLNVVADLGFHSREAVVSLDKFHRSVDSRVPMYSIVIVLLD
jgi:hypothetical protein